MLTEQILNSISTRLSAIRLSLWRPVTALQLKRPC